MVDGHRSDADLGGAARPECTVLAGPLNAMAEWDNPRVDMPLVMTAFNHTMVKHVNKEMGWPASTALSMSCTLGDLPISLTVTSKESYKNFMEYCIDRGVDAMKKQGLVSVSVRQYTNPRRNKAVARPQKDTPLRPQVAHPQPHSHPSPILKSVGG